MIHLTNLTSWASGSRPALLAVALSLSGCASVAPKSYTVPVAPSEKPTGKEAYLYGSFHVDPAADHPRNYETIILVLSCRSEGARESTYTIRFSIDRPLQVIEIPPSTCTMTQILLNNQLGWLLGVVLVRGFMQDEQFAAGKAYYLGDLFAAASSTRYAPVTLSWRLGEAVNNYEKTTADMRAAFPGLAALETEDRMLATCAIADEPVEWRVHKANERLFAPEQKFSLIRHREPGGQPRGPGPCSTSGENLGK
ncbi:hypothetical protein [Sorangium sp. So ce394]|uniref:hypothetical protein n=1 Tax=Sorangium sp. So ce394 TaxID=3133310 RepID=UPI003F5B9A49